MSSPARIRHVDVLVIDDDRELADSLHAFLADEGYDVVTALTLDEAYRALPPDTDISVAMVDLMMPGIDGLTAMDNLHRRWPRLPVVIMTGFGTIETAVDAMKRGAEDYVTKPFDREAVRKKIGRIVELSRLRSRVERLESDLECATNPFGSLVHTSEQMDAVIDQARRLAATSVPVLIIGETGTGKELLAHAIHDAGPRVSEPFLAVNCGALPHELIESELFGVCKGAFTGATEDKPGIFRAAKNGTVFLDEIAEMPPAAQVKLLRVLQEKEVRPVGGTKTLAADARIIAATNRPLRQLRGQHMREDLYYRLSTAVIEIPPLRARRQDIGALAHHFAEQCAVRYNRQISFDSSFLDELRRYDFPGNVRELEGYIEFWASTSDPGPVELGGATIERFRSMVAQARTAGHQAEELHHQYGDPRPDQRLPHDALSMQSVQADAIRRALTASGGHRARAAKMLGISRDTLWRKMRDFGISAEKA
jgi:DNA-binding NtrC family response regulator